MRIDSNKIPEGYWCKTCGKGVDEVSFSISQLNDCFYIKNTCNRCNDRKLRGKSFAPPKRTVRSNISLEFTKYFLRKKYDN